MVHKKKIAQSSSASRKRILLISIFVLLLVYSITILLVSIFAIGTPYQVQTFEYDFKVRDIFAFNLDTDSFHFGSGPAGTSLKREMSISVDLDSRVVINWDGPGILYVENNDFKILSNESIDILFELIIPSDLDDGNYSGKMNFLFYES